MDLIVRLFVPSEAGIRALWDGAFDKMRETLDSSFARDPLAFGCWLSATDTLAFTVHKPDAPSPMPIGLFVFSNIINNDSAFAHIFVWERSGVTSRDLVNAAQASCGAMLRNFNLARISGLTPVSLSPALTFAHWVGFKWEGTVRQAVRFGGWREDATLTGLLPEDLAAASRGNMVEEEARNG